ncbi:MAG: DUF1887 family protein [Treponema sp.]|jgi:hypothetical protein|nr:DUF1887 family protein [Treponema sp.]
MKHYLLTWYGITDLKASLGLEETDGPILGALKTKDYTDIVILAYTNPAKDPNSLSNDLRIEWKKWLNEPPEKRSAFPREKTQQLVDAVSNTVTGHTIFIEWLKFELAAAGINVNLQIVPKELKHLNDADGIYKAAAAALKLVLDDNSEKTLTSFVSPGTPVMAYTWALIARTNPQLNIGVISSSDPRKPPEKIELPIDLLQPMHAAVQTEKPSVYDVIIHLLGRERMPIYFGMIQFQARKHIFITTQEYADAADTLSKLIPSEGGNTVMIINNPFKPADTRKAILQQAACFSKETKVAVNMTGGTKLMFAGALSACWEHGLEPFYFEINNHDIIYIRDGSTVPFVGIKSVTNFFAINGFSVITQGKWENRPCRETRLNVTRKLWEYRETIRVLYKNEDFQKYINQCKKTPNQPFYWKWKNSHASLDINMSTTLNINGEEISTPDCDDFGQYLGGGWFEEYVFDLLRNLEQKNNICDLRIGLEVNYVDQLQERKKIPVGEFDCAFTDGKRLWLIECKVGGIKQEHIQKLENNLKIYGGIAAKGLLISAFPISDNHMKRISSSTSIYAIQPEDLQGDAILKIIAS